MTETQVLYANIASNIVALLMLLVSRRWRNAGRFLFFALFLWAAQTNLRIAIWTPTAYLEYARWALEPYRRFILGPFARHVGVMVGAIAFGQAAIAVLVALRGRLVTLGLAGAMVFLLAIAPLGRGSAFPFSLIVSFAALRLMRHRYERTLVAEAALRYRGFRGRHTFAARQVDDATDKLLRGANPPLRAPPVGRLKWRAATRNRRLSCRPR
jgi:hypothetical protein